MNYGYGAEGFLMNCSCFEFAMNYRKGATMCSTAKRSESWDYDKGGSIH